MSRARAAVTATDRAAVTRSQLEAVHVLLNEDRLARECDILMTAALAELRAGARSTDHLVSVAQRAWPGAGIDHARLGIALSAAEGAGYVCRVDSPTPSWALTDAGLAEAESAHDWTDEELRRTAAQIRERVEQSYGRLTDEESRLWLHLLCQAVAEGIRYSFGVLQGDIEGLPGRYAFPRSFDQGRIDAYIAGLSMPDDAKVTLSALVVDAIDRTSEFGNNLVSHVTIGFVLLAFLARRDNMRARDLVGSLRGKWALLDTMILLRLLGGPLYSRPVWDAVAAAQRAGMTVVVAEHTMEEFLSVVEGSRGDAADLEGAIADGIAIPTLAAVVSNEPLRLWLQGQGAGIYRNWQSFRGAANALAGRLAGAGVTVRERYAGPGALVTTARNALTAELGQGAEMRRRPAAIERDGISMAMVWNHRTANPTAGEIWPSAWIVTDDTHLSPAYRTIASADHVELCLAPGQWVALVSTFAESAALADLAVSATSLIADETLFELSSSIDTTEAIEIARLLDPEARTAPLELRLEQLSLRHAIEGAADSEAPIGDLEVGIVTRVAARRSIRAQARRAALVDAHRRDFARANREVEAGKLELEQVREQARAREAALVLEREAAVTAARVEERRLFARRVGVALAGVVIVAVGACLWTILHGLGFDIGDVWQVVFVLIGIAAGFGLWQSSRGYRSDTATEIGSLAGPAIAACISFAISVAIALAIDQA